MQEITYEEQTKITRAIIKSAVLMLEFGAESILIEQTAQRLGAALGVDSVQMSLIPAAIVLTTLHKNQSVTTTRSVHHKPINMSIVCDVQTMVIEVEKYKHPSEFVNTTIKHIKPNLYNKWLIVFMVGFACASFAILQDGDVSSFFITFVVASIAMYTRQILNKKRFMMIITFGVTAFIATILGSIIMLFYPSQTPNVVLASSVLLLVPGVPFINSFLDSFKGYLSMGWGRWLQASLLTVASSMGIVLAMSVLNIKGW
ncbi:MAG: threonine/serine exporter family protein [Poseidonibacter sp.]